MPAAAMGRGLRRGLEKELSPISTRAATEEAPSEPSMDSPSSAGEGPAEEMAGQHPVALSRERALALQMELMAAYSSPIFQKRLHELGREHPPGTKSFNHGRHKLIRQLQASIIPLYGFDNSEDGVQLMLEAFTCFQQDPDIQVNTVAINDLLSLDAQAPTEAKRRLIQKPLTKLVMIDLLRALFVEFSKAPFQADVRNLKLCADVIAGRVARKETTGGDSADPDGYFHLKGRASTGKLCRAQPLTVVPKPATPEV
ncbi:unnamed protein product [Symbiodinium sp. CCMP2456]|nr:unnamed protein product [Symbiodinium sp. CCMP2456]